jgi:hypothetical protein
MAEPIWLSTTEVAERMGLSPSWVRRRSPIFKRTHPSGIRQVKDKLGNLCWEWEVGFLELLKPKRNKTTKPKRNKTKQIKELETPTTTPQEQPIPTAKAEVLSGTYEDSVSGTNSSGTNEEVIFELGLHSQSDGSLMQVFTQDEYDRFKSMLIKLPLIEQSHNDLKESYEAHVETYRSENAYLRKSLETQQEITNQLVETHRKAIQGINQRNYIESQRLQEQNNPTIVLPKD